MIFKKQNTMKVVKVWIISEIMKYKELKANQLKVSTLNNNLR